METSFDVFCWAKRATSRPADDEGANHHNATSISTATDDDTNQSDTKPNQFNLSARVYKARAPPSLVGGVI